MIYMDHLGQFKFNFFKQKIQFIPAIFFYLGLCRLAGCCLGALSKKTRKYINIGLELATIRGIPVYHRLFAQSGETALTFETIIRFLRILQDVECSKPNIVNFWTPPKNFLTAPQKKLINHATSLNLYWFSYPHWSRELMSPVCGIFIQQLPDLLGSCLIPI